MKRPSNLPRFEHAPLNEVVIGVQFETPDAYSQVLISEVRKLFEERFPRTQEHAPLESTFELFGGVPQFARPGFKLMDRPDHSRYWFTSPEAEEIVQFQQDRLLHNWRVVDGHQAIYPHFEHVAEQFREELGQLETYFQSLGSPLKILQFEVSYVNNIDADEIADPSRWFTLFNYNGLSPETSYGGYQEIVRLPNGSPYGRFRLDLQTGYTTRFQKMFVANLSVKGIPRDHTIDGCLASLYMARSVIVSRFEAMCTTEAKTIWGRNDG